MDWLVNTIPAPDGNYQKLAEQRQAQLTKPSGSLGYLEVLAVRLAALQTTESPVIERVHVSVFAADHGVAEESVSAFPQQVTREMVKNFARGGAAVNVLSRYVNADFEVIDCGLKQAVPDKKVIKDSAGNGTANFAHQPAMTQLQLEQALNAGRKAACRAQKKTGRFIYWRRNGYSKHHLGNCAGLCFAGCGCGASGWCRDGAK